MRPLGNVLLLVAAVALIAFPICYHILTGGSWRHVGAWRTTTMGVHLMVFMGVFAEVMVFAVANFIWDLPSWVRPLIWFQIGAVAWWRVVLLFVIQHSESDD
jgi:hypothetical protein